MRRALWLTVLAVLLAPCVRADEGEALVSRADEAFRSAVAVTDRAARADAFVAAAARYDEATTARPGNGALHYDSANAHLLAGDVGRAVLHYRRAERLRPGDERVTANLAIARTRRRDRVEATATRSVVETVAFWHRGLPLPTKVPLGVALWVLGLVGLALAAARGRSARGARALRRIGVLLAIAGLALGISAWLDVRELDDPAAAVVVVDEVPLRSGDGESYPSRYEQPVHAGAEVHVVTERGGWSEVELLDGTSGWVPTPVIERVVQSVR